MKVAVGISGGVDSSVAALLLREDGHEVIGVTMTLGRTDEDASLAAARRAAESLKIPLRVCDLAKQWSAQVLDDIRSEYRSGRTPNPCVRCNERIKFGLFPQWAFETLGCEAFATGHYARLERRGEGVALLRGVDRAKDQSYFLYRVSRDVLAHTLFPLGAMTKDEVRRQAREAGVVAADAGDSQDFCGGDPKALLTEPDREGDVVTREGKVIGRHRGFWHHTVGQRKGLGIGGGTPFYVLELDARNNRIIVGTREQTLVKTLTLERTVGRIDYDLPVKVRSAGEPRLLSDGISGIAPGQSAVFYDGDEIVGGGIITNLV